MNKTIVKFIQLLIVLCVIICAVLVGLFCAETIKDYNTWFGLFLVVVGIIMVWKVFKQ